MISDKEHDELMKMTIEVRRKIQNEFECFIEKNKKIGTEQLFFCISSTLASLTAQIVYAIFKKDISIELKYNYIDGILEMSKDFLRNAESMIEAGITFQ